jgi:hypothetical protein
VDLGEDDSRQGDVPLRIIASSLPNLAMEGVSARGGRDADPMVVWQHGSDARYQGLEHEQKVPFRYFQVPCSRGSLRILVSAVSQPSDAREKCFKRLGEACRPHD